MKFSGHETFQVREGWLHKGMQLIVEEPEKMGDELVADYLGVGRNMARSIRHWLLATELAKPTQELGGRKLSVMELTDFGKQVWKFDPYFLELGTWWMLHVNLVCNAKVTTSWAWFFNNFRRPRFDRSVCLEGLKRYISMARRKVPSSSTLDRDLGCLLASYSRTVPDVLVDPEDGADSPFRELGLLTFYKGSGYYQMNQAVKSIPSAIFGYSLAKAFPDLGSKKAKTDILIGDAVRQPGGPGSVFCLSAESLFEVVSNIESMDKKDISISGLAGERAIRTRCCLPTEWSESFYEQVAGEVYVK